MHPINGTRKHDLSSDYSLVVYPPADQVAFKRMLQQELKFI